MKNTFTGNIAVLEQKILPYKLKLLNRFSSRAMKKNNSKFKVVVSMTSYPKRLGSVYLSIESIFNQSFSPDKIILWLSEEELCIEDIPISLKKMRSRGLDIRFVEDNLKSYKKLFYTIQEFGDYLIITCDDDTIYPKDFLKEMICTHQKHPKCIVGYRCSWMEKKENDQLIPYKSWKQSNTDIPSLNLFPTGVGGVLYPPGSLHSEVLNKSLFMRLAPTGDDIWFKGMSLKNHTKVVAVNSKFTEFPSIKGSQIEALWHRNVVLNENDLQVKNIFDYYNLYEYF